MKIGVSDPPPHSEGVLFVYVKPTAGDGITGIGEMYAATFGPHTVVPMVEDVCERHVVGADPFRLEFYGAGASAAPIRHGRNCRACVYSAAPRCRVGTSSVRRRASRSMNRWAEKCISAYAAVPTFGRNLETQYAPIALHLCCGSVEGAANIQVSICLPSFLIVERIQQWDSFHAKIPTKPLHWDDGYVIAPSDPGCGVGLNEIVADAYPCDGDSLDLQMADRPVRWDRVGTRRSVQIAFPGRVGCAKLRRRGGKPMAPRRFWSSESQRHDS